MYKDEIFFGGDGGGSGKEKGEIPGHSPALVHLELTGYDWLFCSLQSFRLLDECLYVAHVTSVL